MSQTYMPLNAAGRRARRRTLARRDGARCAYCRTPFAADLADATIDHVVPLSLFRTWRQEHTVLACRRCNTRKGDRLPLTMALLLCWTTAGEHREHPAVNSTPPVMPTVTEMTVGMTTPATVNSPARVHEHAREHGVHAAGEHGPAPVHDRPKRVFTGAVTGPDIPVDWRLLARLAALREAAVNTGQPGARPTPEQRASTPARTVNTRVHGAFSRCVYAPGPHRPHAGRRAAA
ncbi:HNH endonuclease [Streptomyces chrestomyceticus]|uniref:HNH endonuclease n=1 Tax=Streptomyces chrestomyceticus TaxID=68185 RepID=UPI0033C53E61